MRYYSCLFTNTVSKTYYSELLGTKYIINNL